MENKALSNLMPKLSDEQKLACYNRVKLTRPQEDEMLIFVSEVIRSGPVKTAARGSLKAVVLGKTYPTLKAAAIDHNLTAHQLKRIYKLKDRYTLDELFTKAKLDNERLGNRLPM